MQIKNGLIFDLNEGFVSRDLYTEGTLISESSKDEVVIDAADCYVIPGLVDLHFHGAVGEDFSDASMEGLQKIADFELSEGVTYICQSEQSSDIVASTRLALLFVTYIPGYVKLGNM